MSVSVAVYHRTLTQTLLTRLATDRIRASSRGRCKDPLAELLVLARKFASYIFALQLSTLTVDVARTRPIAGPPPGLPSAHLDARSSNPAIRSGGTRAQVCRQLPHRQSSSIEIGSSQTGSLISPHASPILTVQGASASRTVDGDGRARRGARRADRTFADGVSALDDAVLNSTRAMV